MAKMNLASLIPTAGLPFTECLWGSATELLKILTIHVEQGLVPVFY